MSCDSSYRHDQIAENTIDRNQCRGGSTKNCMYYNDACPYSHDDYFAVQYSDRKNIIPNDMNYLNVPDLGTNEYMPYTGALGCQANETMGCNAEGEVIPMEHEVKMMPKNKLMLAVLLGGALVAAIVFYRRFGMPTINKDYLVIGALAALVFFFFFA